jgi:hypothetical protein
VTEGIHGRVVTARTRCHIPGRWIGSVGAAMSGVCGCPEPFQSSQRLPEPPREARAMGLYGRCFATGTTVGRRPSTLMFTWRRKARPVIRAAAALGVGSVEQDGVTVERFEHEVGDGGLDDPEGVLYVGCATGPVEV